MKENITRLFDKITPIRSDDEIIANVIGKAENMTKKRTGGAKKPLIAVCASITALGLGVTAAAATGLIDFNEIFGGKMIVQDEALAGELVGAAKDFTWSVSDNDYVIELKGVTGSKSDMLLVYEIVRADGKPVTDFMSNIPTDDELYGHCYIEFSDESAFTAAFDDNRYTINEEGNITAYNRIITNGYLSGQYYTVQGVYPEKMLWTDENTSEFQLEWNIGFTYSPSGTAILSKAITREAPVIDLNYWNAYTGAEADTKEFEITCSSFSSVGGMLELVHYGEVRSAYYEKYNDIYLIMKDGSQHPCTIIADGPGISYRDHTATSTINAEVRYSDTKDGIITALDIDNIKAVSINGTVFDLA